MHFAFNIFAIIFFIISIGTTSALHPRMGGGEGNNNQQYLGPQSGATGSNGRSQQGTFGGGMNGTSNGGSKSWWIL